ncbi:hypothetical protein IGI04_021937 [Brassica rapa subsp. trilocularis]|uniref:Uncharacterized protein n=1 Tax=Brassica rapa subsp. trilocularis TaxID=1813537 RepID=A0ABQ7LZJ9_BRACM|nr:hypothetical protein IGI04_021937 [Brassica rapa subsp. trilocularis]
MVCELMRMEWICSSLIQSQRSCLPPLMLTVSPLSDTTSRLAIRFSTIHSVYVIQPTFHALTKPVLQSRFGFSGSRFAAWPSQYGHASSSFPHLADVIGELTAVKSTVIDVLQGKERVMATIKLGHLLECHFPTKRLMQGRTLTVGTSSSGLIYKRWT